MRNLKDFGFDGKTVLRFVLEALEYQSISQAIAALTMFSHPQTVEQSRYRNLFRVIRCRVINERGKYQCLVDGSRIMLDDNTAPTEAFIWANGISRSTYQDVQFNHICPDSTDVSLYTNLANICVSPAFLAKLTDTDKEICELLRFRAYDLYGGFAPAGIIPNKPAVYDNLSWAAPLPPVYDLEHTFRMEMSRKRSNRTVRCAKELGWLFSSFEPDMRM